MLESIEDESLRDESIMEEGHDELILRKSNSEEVGLEDDNQAVLDDLGYLYI